MNDHECRSRTWLAGAAMIGVCILFAIFSGIPALAVDAEDPRFGDAAKRAAQDRHTAIVDEIKQLGNHDWAGDYYAGDGLGRNASLTLAPTSGYIFEWHGCLGLYDRNYGAVTARPDRIRLSFTFPNKTEGFAGVAPEFIAIRWGERRYLVPADDIVGFCNDINMGFEPRSDIHGSHFLRRGDEEQKVDGWPTLPAAYQAYLLAEPVEAQIVDVGLPTLRPSIVEWMFKDTPVTLDAGSKQGLRPGMELTVIEPFKVESVRLTRVEEERSEGVMIQAGEDEPGPQKGWRLSTRLRWARVKE